MTFEGDYVHPVTPVPHILVGKIDRRHLIPNATGQIYLIGLSQSNLASIGGLSFYSLLGYIIFICYKYSALVIYLKKNEMLLSQMETLKNYWYH